MTPLHALVIPSWMVDRPGESGEFDALARLAAGMLDATTATLTVLDEYAVRLGASGVSWPVADEERFLRWIGRAEGSNANPLSVYDLAMPDVPGAETLVGDGLRGAVVLPLPSCTVNSIS